MITTNYFKNAQSKLSHIMWPEFGPQLLAPCWTTWNSPLAGVIWSTPLRGAANAQGVWGPSSERAQKILSASVPILPILLFYEWWRPQPTEANWLRNVTAFAKTDLILCFLRHVHRTLLPNHYRLSSQLLKIIKFSELQAMRSEFFAWFSPWSSWVLLPYSTT